MISGRIATLVLAASLAILAVPASASDAAAAAVPEATVVQAPATLGAAGRPEADEANAVARLKQIYRCKAKPEQLEAGVGCMKLIGTVEWFTGARS